MNSSFENQFLNLLLHIKRTGPNFSSLEEVNLTPALFTYLNTIQQFPISTLNEVSQHLGVTPASVSKAINRLEKDNLIKREHLPMMKNGAVLVDVAVDQGGCFETTRATTHDDPVYTIDGVVHYAVANMPGAVALSSTLALTSTTLPHGLAIANKGLEKAIQDSAMLRKGLNIYKGRLIYKRVALDLDLPFTPLQEILT